VTEQGKKSRIEMKVTSQRLVITPEILATWEVEIRRIEVPGLPRQTVHKNPSPKQSEQNGLQVWLKWQSTCFANMRT
jgi:hypothetical protein